MAKNQVVAIDIGTSSAKIVHIEKTSDTLNLVDVATIAYSDPDNTEQISDAVKQLWDKLKLKQTIFNKHKLEVAIALPRRFVVTKRLPNIPPATTDEQLPTMVAMAAETELPFQSDDAIFTYHDVNRSPEAVSLELVSSRRDTVSRYIDAMKDIGISPSAVIPSMFAIATVARNSLKDYTERVAIVDIGGGQTDFCLMHGDKMEFSRGFAVSGNQLTRHLMSELQIDADEAVEEKQQITAFQASARTWTRQFIAELERSISAAQREVIDDEIEISEIWLCGGGARIPELAETCEEQLQIPTRLWNPIYSGSVDTSAVSTSILETHGDTLAVPLGVGIHILESEEPISLLPQEVGVKRAEFSKKRQQLIGASVGGLALLTIVLGGITWSSSQKSKEDLLDGQIADYQSLQTEANKHLALNLILADKLTHQASPLDILHALSTLFKDRTKVAWKTFEVNNLDNLKNARITFSLQSNSHESLDSMLGVLSRSDMFTNIQEGERTSTGDERRATIEVKINCSLTPNAIQKFAQERYPIAPPMIKEDTSEDLVISPPENKDWSEDSDKEEIEENEDDKEKEQ
ncbi:hypothetical protein C6497_10530 [Candidatus Poribacteria bacterium]|nr:MAG: hypothetical protein C6497_10530 [Candidatus Poribacteria bacterium]